MNFTYINLFFADVKFNITLVKINLLHVHEIYKIENLFYIFEFQFYIT